jgi:hypothetical protein
MNLRVSFPLLKDTSQFLHTGERQSGSADLLGLEDFPEKNLASDGPPIIDESLVWI